jgi:hypothetical protein
MTAQAGIGFTAELNVTASTSALAPRKSCRLMPVAEADRAGLSIVPDNAIRVANLIMSPSQPA